MSEEDKTIPVGRLFDKLKENPEFMKEYNALEEEFNLAAMLIKARDFSGLSQEEIAQRMETKQSGVARLERGNPNVSLRSLRRYAKATGCRLEINMIPVEKPQRNRHG